MNEVMLQGGRTTPGVVRVGDTVRRPSNGNSGFVRVLLSHLAACGFEGAPRWLGTDAAEREVFSFVEGEVPSELSLVDDDALQAAARLIRSFHDRTVDLSRMADTDLDEEVVCHNDLSPCNFVFRDGMPVAIIDFDAASPGTRAHDLGYAAWLWLDCGNPEVGAQEQGRRLGLFARAYGDITPKVILASMVKRQRLSIASGQHQASRRMSTWATGCLEWTLLHSSELQDTTAWSDVSVT